MQTSLRLGPICDLRASQSHFNSKRAVPRRNAHVTQASNRKDRASQSLAVTGVTLTSASQAVAAATVPTGSGVPVEGYATATGDPSVDGIVDQIIDVIRTTSGYVKQGLDVAGVGAQKAKDAVDYASPYVRSAADAVSPYARSAVDTVRDAAGPAFRNAQPTLQSSLDDAQRLLAQQGLDTKEVTAASQVASEKASGLFYQVKPLLSSAVTFVQTTPLEQLGEYALGGAAAYLLVPKLAGLAVGNLRGYAGNVSAAAALDMVSARGNTFIVDLRSPREKESNGALDVPGNRVIELEFAEVGDRKLRGQLRNVPALELQVTSMEVAALKRIAKNSTLLLMDRNGSMSKAVAKQIRAKGFKNAYVISNGFNGWSSAKLRVKPSSSVSKVDVLPAINSLARNTVRGGSRPPQGRKALPSGRG